MSLANVFAMDFNRKRLILTHKLPLFAVGFAVICLFKSICVFANAEDCTRAFGPSSHPFFKHLYEWSPTKPDTMIITEEIDDSVVYTGYNPETEQIGFRRKLARSWRNGFRLRPMGWTSEIDVRLGSSTPQGDVRNFIYLAGQELAQRLRFEFVMRGDHVFLLVPSAAYLEKVVPVLNRILIADGKEPIAYLPVRAGFVKPGETLELSNNSDAPILIRFPYADLDPILAAHEVGYHLGSLIFPEKFHLKSRAINLETSRVSDLIAKSRLPSFARISRTLIANREGELDSGNANLQYALAVYREVNTIKKYSELSLAKMPFHSIAMKSLRDITFPYYTPSEVVARQLIVSLGLQSWFSQYPHLLSEMDIDLTRKDKKKLNNQKPAIGLTGPEKMQYVAFIKNILNSQTTNSNNQMVAARENLKVWMIDFYMGLDLRIKDIIEAADKAARVLQL